MTKKFGELLLLLVGAVIVLNLIGSAVAPYLHMVGLTIATAMILLIVLGVGWLIVSVFRHGGGDDRGM